MKENLDKYQKALHHCMLQYHLRALDDKYSGQVPAIDLLDEAKKLLEEEVSDFLAKQGE